MGCHWCPGYADVISTKLLSMLVPEEYASFMEMVGDELEDWVREEFVSPEVDIAYERLWNKFKECYNLELGIEYLVDCIDGEEEGVYWYVSNAYVKNPDLVKLEESLGSKVLNRVWQVSYA